MNNLVLIEREGQRVLTTQQLAQLYGANPKNISDNFNNHKHRFQQDKHYFKLEGNELKEFKQGSPILSDTLKYASILYLWREKGALRHAKILDTDKAWDVYEQLEETYFKVKEIEKHKPQSQLEILQQTINQLVIQDKKQKELENKIQATQNQITDIKDTIVNREEDWRKEVGRKLRKIGLKHGDYKTFVDESYRLLQERARCNLKQRLENLKSRMALNGSTRTSIDKANYLYVIQLDTKLREIYINIVSQLYIKHAA